MADKTIDSELIRLKTGMWGLPNPKYGTPDDGFTGSDHHSVVAAAYPVGTVVAYYNDGTAGLQGMSEFVYLKFVANAGVALTVKALCVQDAAGDPFTVTNDPDHALVAVGNMGNMRPCFGLSAVTTLYYGWFWCGGVVPEGAVSGLGGNYATDSTVAAGYPMRVVNLTADALGLGLKIGASATANTGTHNSDIVIGWADTADAA